MSQINKINPTIIFKLFVIAIFLIVVVYLYFVSITVTAAVESKENLKNLENINREYQELESQYFNLVGKFDLDYAQQLGFVDQGKKVDYVVRQTSLVLR
jgi:hypothetical protein